MTIYILTTVIDREIVNEAFTTQGAAQKMQRMNFIDWARQRNKEDFIDEIRHDLCKNNYSTDYDEYEIGKDGAWANWGDVNYDSCIAEITLFTNSEEAK